MSLYGFQLSLKFLSQVYIFDCQESLKLTSGSYVLCFEFDFYSYSLVRLTLWTIISCPTYDEDCTSRVYTVCMCLCVSRSRRVSVRMVVGFALELWVRILLMAMCTGNYIMWLSLSVTCRMSVVFLSGYSGFFHQ
jgi:hypothetical protein